jgi:dynein assembly factor 3
MAGQIQASLGHYGFHGLSATFDLIEAIGEGVNGVTANNLEPLNVLLINPGDIRHILTTISRRRRHKKNEEPLRKINFYLLESPIEVLARNILLLELINDYEVPIRQRATVYLEIFGNCKVQDRTAKYVEQLGHQLRSFIADGTGRLEGVVDLSLLKYKEKDDLDFAYRNYSKGVEFDIETLRDHRLRG